MPLAPDTPATPGPSTTEVGRRARRRRRTIAIAVTAGLAAVGIAVSAALWFVPRDEVAMTPDISQRAGSLGHQELLWEDCGFAPGDPPAGVDASTVKCATVTVPKDWHAPDPSETWDVRISFAQNIAASDPAAETLFVHAGGPFPSLSFSATVQQWTPELRSTTNYVSFDQRGLGQSSTVTCDYAYDPSSGAAAQPRAIGDACADDPDLATMTTEQVAYDMDFIRHLLGVKKVSYLGYSYGTWLGAWFGKLFPENIKRMVLDSPIDGTSATYERSWTGQDLAIDRQFRLLTMNWLARNDASYGLSDDPEAISDRYFAATDAPEMDEAAYLVWASTGAATLQSKPVNTPFLASVIAHLIAEGESDNTGDPVDRATRVINALGLPDASREAALDQFAIYMTAPSPVEPGELVHATHSSSDDFLRCADGEWTQGEEYWDDYNTRTANDAPFAAQLKRFDQPPVCAFWPADVEMPAAPADFPETIVLQSELDPLTPWAQGQTLGLELPNTSLIAVDNEGVHGVFPYGTDNVDRPVLDFLRGIGDRPASTIVPAKPLPGETVTYEYWSPLKVSEDRREPSFTDPGTTAPTASLTSDQN